VDREKGKAIIDMWYLPKKNTELAWRWSFLCALAELLAWVMGWRGGLFLKMWQEANETIEWGIGVLLLALGLRRG